MKQRKYGADFKTGTAREWLNFFTACIDDEGTLSISSFGTQDEEGSLLETDTDFEAAKPLVSRWYQERQGSHHA